MSFTRPLDTWLQGLLSATTPAERKRLARKIAIDLRKSQIERIAAQKNPDGSPFEPRRPQPKLRDKSGRIRRKMFARMATARYIKVRADAGAATVEIDGRAARIARVHQYGLEDTVNRRGLRVRYPIRAILGITSAEEQSVADTVVAHLSP